jgi:hypothetical protein
MESIRLESVRNHEELAPTVSCIGEQYRVETTKIKKFETETESIKANCKRFEERVTQLHSSIRGVEKSISKINDKINDKINCREQNQAPLSPEIRVIEKTSVPVVNPRHEISRPDKQSHRDNEYRDQSTRGLTYSGALSAPTEPENPLSMLTRKEPDHTVQETRSNISKSNKIQHSGEMIPETRSNYEGVSGQSGNREYTGNDSEPDIFEGVTYKRKARYYIAGISSRSTRTGLMNYVTRKGVRITHFVLFNQDIPVPD